MSVIDVEQLLEELSRQRRDRAGISTTSVNLLAYVDDPQLLQRMTERLDTLAERNVSRTVLLAHDDREHLVCSHCTEIGDTLVTRSEQIQLAVKGIGPQELRSIAHALLVPSVRTVLLWGGSHLTDPRFTELAELADTIVLFSSATDSGTGPLHELLQVQNSSLEPKIRDLAFLRLLPWQDMIAQFFDDPDLASDLPHISRLEVVSGSAAEGYYLAGWLASRLSWDPCGKNEFCNADGGKITMELRQDGTPRHIYRTRLQAGQSTFTAEIEKDAEDLICLSVEGEKHRPQRCVPLHDVDMISLIEQAVFARNDIFIETLHMVRRLLEHER